MLSVIVAPGDSQRLAGLLAALTPAAVEGLVREVLIVAQGPEALLEALCAETGADTVADLPQAVARARSDWLLIAPPELRLRDGWVERLGDHLRDGPRKLRLTGPGGGLFRRAPAGVLVSRLEAARSAQAGLQGLARKLGPGAARLS